MLREQDVIRNELLARYEKRNDDMTKEVSKHSSVRDKMIGERAKRVVLVSVVGFLQRAKQWVDQETGWVRDELHHGYWKHKCKWTNVGNLLIAVFFVQIYQFLSNAHRDTQKMLKEQNSAQADTIASLKKEIRELELNKARHESQKAELEYNLRAKDYNVEIIKN